jgi:hypothetical protein
MSSDSAAKAVTELAGALADVQRKLPKKAKMPKPKADPKTSLTKGAAMAKQLEDDVKKLVKSLKDYQSTLSDVEADAADFSALVGKSDFGLTKGNPDDDKIINFASYTLTKCLDDIALGSRSPRKVAATILSALNGADLTAF